MLKREFTATVILASNEDIDAGDVLTVEQYLNTMRPIEVADKRMNIRVHIKEEVAHGRSKG